MAASAEYVLSSIGPTDKGSLSQQEALLRRVGIQRDRNLDYSVGLYDGENMVATGSCFRNTLRCMAVDPDYQGEALLNRVVTRLIEHQCECGNTDLFVYTKCESEKFFRSLGFYEIARVRDTVVFMENRRDGFAGYLHRLARTKVEGDRIAAVVMNANPFTLGHLHLLERVSRENDGVHVFVLSEDMSLVPYSVRYDLVVKGTAHLGNLVYHPSGSYMISAATFPSYFLEDEDAVSDAHARLDIEVFKRIAASLGITRRYVGEEPFSRVTSIYNERLKEELDASSVECIIVPRKEGRTGPISASRVRSLIHQGNVEAIKESVPHCTYEFFTSREGEAIVQRIQRSRYVLHH